MNDDLSHLPRARLHKDRATIGCGRWCNGEQKCRGRWGHVYLPESHIVQGYEVARESGIYLRHNLTERRGPFGLSLWAMTSHADRDRDGRPRRARQMEWQPDEYWSARAPDGTVIRFRPSPLTSNAPQPHKSQALPSYQLGVTYDATDFTQPSFPSHDHFVPARDLPALAICPRCRQLNLIEWEVLMQSHISKTIS